MTWILASDWSRAPAPIFTDSHRFAVFISTRVGENECSRLIMWPDTGGQTLGMTHFWRIRTVLDTVHFWPAAGSGYPDKDTSEGGRVKNLQNK